MIRVHVFCEGVANSILSERQEFKTPEHINNNPLTAPSKRILRHCNSYDKIHHGSLIAIDTGLDVIRKECRHFNEWIKKIEELGG